ncbi:glycerol-3-phosphate acyltransferase 1, mitochondrial isoform X2 [Contarinia nasturtii]|nr:glycerol-3-phosphate acyltransferase 1, mitochondrial isoform X2 [Contarinia nasturtii]XP_031639081.1 glycerol-3-phosphate acyltransferase 1, mitochondrial isoform X2 [Contarinia nasturtii]
MVDVMQTYMQDAISLVRMHRTETDNHDDHGTTTDYGARRRATERQRIRIQNKEQEKQSFDRSLYQIKETPMQTLQVQSKKLNGLACDFCSPSNNEQHLNAELAQQDVINILRVGTYNKSLTKENGTFFNWIQSWFPFMVHCLRLTRFPLPQVADSVLKDDRLKNAIKISVEKTVEELKTNAGNDFDEDWQYEKTLKENKQRAQRLLLDMRSKISDRLLRFASLVIFKLLPSFMSGVIAHPAHIDMLKKTAAASPNVPLIFLPLHRSHLDYILVSFILYNNEIRAPIVAAGDNLRIPFFGALLRGLGAFFIKRKIDPVAGKKDIVYRAVLHTYMQHALAAHHNVEFFIEGGRTRTGKPCMPKSGVLSVIIDALNSGTIDDAFLVPVSVNYERLCDGNFVYEQLGEKKKPEKFTSAVSAIWAILNSKYGQMRIDFNEPFSLKNLIKAYENLPELNSIETTPHILKRLISARRLKHQPSTSSLYGTDVVNEEHRALVDSIARHVVYDCATATACMTTNAVAFLLLTRFRNGDTIDVLADALDDLRKTLHGVRTISFTGDSHSVIKYAVDLLGPNLITMEEKDGKTFITPVANIRSFIELSYYSNSLATHFVLDAVVMCTILKMTESHSCNSNSAGYQIKRSELMELCKKYCDMLRYEFLFNKPCQKLDNLLDDSLERLKEQYLLSIPSEANSMEDMKARRYYAHFDESSEDGYDIPTSDEITIALPEGGHGKRVVLSSVLAPYSHTYMAVIRSLDSLRDYGLTENEFIKVCVAEITKQVENGNCKYSESISTDTMRNCMKMLEKSGYIEVSNVGGTRIVALSKKYDNIDGVQDITKQIDSIVTF